MALSRRRSPIVWMNCNSPIGWVARPSINLNQTTEYAYDLAGNHIREKTTQVGVVYQDNQIAYNAMGQLRWMGDGRAYVSIEYDKAGNPVRTFRRT